MASADGVRAGKAFVEVNAKDSTGAGLAAIQRRLSGFGQRLTSIGKGFMVAGAAILAPMAFAVRATARLGAELEKSAAELGTTVDAIAEMRGMSKETAAGAVDASHALDSIGNSANKAMAAIGSALAPALGRLAELLADGADWLDRFLIRFDSLVPTIAAVGIALVAGGAALAAFGQVAIGIAGLIGATLAVMGVIKAAILFAISPLGIALGVAAAAVAVLTLAWITFVGRFTFKDVARDFVGFGDRMRETWGGIVAAFQAGDIELALRIVGVRLKAEMMRVGKALDLAWSDTVDYFAAGFDDAAFVILDTLFALVAEMKKVWVDFTAWLQKQLKDMVPDGLIDILEWIPGGGLIAPQLRALKGVPDITEADKQAQKRSIDNEALGLSRIMQKHFDDKAADRLGDRNRKIGSWDADIAAADKAAQELVRQANAARLMAEAGRAVDAASRIAQNFKPSETLDAYTRGTSSGSAIAQSLGAGDRIGQKIADHTKRAADGIDKLVSRDGPVYE